VGERAEECGVESGRIGGETIERLGVIMRGFMETVKERLVVLDLFCLRCGGDGIGGSC